MFVRVISGADPTIGSCFFKLLLLLVAGYQYSSSVVLYSTANLCPLANGQFSVTLYSIGNERNVCFPNPVDPRSLKAALAQIGATTAAATWSAFRYHSTVL